MATPLLLKILFLSIVLKTAIKNRLFDDYSGRMFNNGMNLIILLTIGFPIDCSLNIFLLPIIHLSENAILFIYNKIKNIIYNCISIPSYCS